MRRAATRQPLSPSIRRERRDAGDWLDEAVIAPPGAVRGFAAAVEAALIDSVLQHDDRMRLIRRATRLGISRFDANLIIATVQHRAEPRRSPRESTVRQTEGKATAILTWLAAAIMVEVVVVGGLIVAFWR
jgi:hypothetical protein